MNRKGSDRLIEGLPTEKDRKGISLSLSLSQIAGPSHSFLQMIMHVRIIERLLIMGEGIENWECKATSLCRCRKRVIKLSPFMFHASVKAFYHRQFTTRSSAPSYRLVTILAFDLGLSREDYACKTVTSQLVSCQQSDNGVTFSSLRMIC